MCLDEMTKLNREKELEKGGKKYKKRNITDDMDTKLCQFIGILLSYVIEKP